MRWMVLLLGCCLVFGCARAPEAPARRGAACKSNDDCNRSNGAPLRCGELRLCVAGRCEVEPDGGAAHSLPIACRDAG
jgi:hypothetical protein